ncbi:Vacuolar protein sorting-associated protein 20 [Dimargaris cristalligena]|uniref:Snf7-domain-containing protein n=1 Tax=Dimargaris cristalligena TaxID=215637 RepID=A0A4Q0A2J4_9FUNG|nr:Vacuolar protein sorting-associated protein 20 [Dimargaris cristalligena]RKP39572.1 Snf7-domain-containing protein [Dimargaris cristalligena]|eukprot:RKP39572.1 Snf7-domain-containing protein [Dimargaris cristalligena]
MGANGSKNRITPQDRAILDLKVQRDRLKQYTKRINVVLNRETEIAQEHLRRNNKQQALLALRKKKYQEQLLVKTENQLMNLEQLTQTIEFALVEKEVFAGLAQGNQVLKTLNQEMSLENVEKLMEETADAIAYQEEVSEMLGTKLSSHDEAELENELRALQATEIGESAIPELPSVPQKNFPNIIESPQPEQGAVSDIEEAEISPKPARVAMPAE